MRMDNSKSPILSSTPKNKTFSKPSSTVVVDNASSSSSSLKKIQRELQSDFSPKYLTLGSTNHNSPVSRFGRPQKLKESTDFLPTDLACSLRKLLPTPIRHATQLNRTVTPKLSIDKIIDKKKRPDHTPRLSTSLPDMRSTSMMYNPNLQRSPIRRVVQITCMSPIEKLIMKNRAALQLTNSFAQSTPSSNETLKLFRGSFIRMYSSKTPPDVSANTNNSVNKRDKNIDQEVKDSYDVVKIGSKTSENPVFIERKKEENCEIVSIEPVCDMIEPEMQKEISLNEEIISINPSINSSARSPPSGNKTNKAFGKNGKNIDRKVEDSCVVVKYTKESSDAPALIKHETGKIKCEIVSIEPVIPAIVVIETETENEKWTNKELISIDSWINSSAKSPPSNKTLQAHFICTKNSTATPDVSSNSSRSVDENGTRADEQVEKSCFVVDKNVKDTIEENFKDPVLIDRKKEEKCEIVSMKSVLAASVVNESEIYGDEITNKEIHFGNHSSNLSAETTSSIIKTKRSLRRRFIRTTPTYVSVNSSMDENGSKVEDVNKNVAKTSEDLILIETKIEAEKCEYISIAPIVPAIVMIEPEKLNEKCKNVEVSHNSSSPINKTIKNVRRRLIRTTFSTSDMSANSICSVDVYGTNVDQKVDNSCCEVINNVTKTSEEAPVFIEPNIEAEIHSIGAVIPENEKEKYISEEIISINLSEIETTNCIDLIELPVKSAAVAEDILIEPDNVEADLNGSVIAIIDPIEIIEIDESFEANPPITPPTQGQTKYFTDSTCDLVIVENSDDSVTDNTIIDANIIVQQQYMDLIHPTIVKKCPSVSSVDSAKGSSIVDSIASNDTVVNIGDYKIGQLGWARVGSFPFWPCIFCPDDENKIVEYTDRKCEIGYCFYLFINLSFKQGRLVCMSDFSLIMDVAVG